MKKAYAKTGRVCRVTLAVQPEEHVQSIAVCGEFNGWNPIPPWTWVPGLQVHRSVFGAGQSAPCGRHSWW
jgi:hypothetical protein